MIFEIILCIHKDHNQLVNCLKSIDKNLSKEIGLIIVINGNQVDLLEKKIKIYLKSSFYRIITTHQPGLSNALNIGLNASTAKYIIRHDSDDIWLDHRLKLTKDAIKRNPEASIISFSYLSPKDNQNRIKYILKEGYNINFKNLLLKNIINHPTVTYKRNLIIKLGGYREFPNAEDFDLWLRALDNNYIIIKYNIPVILYSSKSISAARRSSQAYLSMSFSLLLLFIKRRSIIFLLGATYQFLKSILIFSFNLLSKK